MIGPLRTAAINPATKPELPLDHTHEMPVIRRLELLGYTAETDDGTRGTLIDAFGTYADPAIAAIVDLMDFRLLAA